MKNALLVKNILDYMDYLKSLSLSVSFCDYHFYFSDYLPELVSYNSHTNPYCSVIKKKPELQSICVCKQVLVYKRCRRGEFYGMCWAGTEEFVYPVKNEEEVIAFISVSGYRGKFHTADKRIKDIAERYSIDENVLNNAYISLKTDLPSKNYLSALIAPLCNMFQLLYLKSKANEKNSEVSTTFKKVMTFISNNYFSDIKLEDIANECHYSSSYIRHMFKKKTNYTITKYITLLRIQQAKYLLKNTDASISEIAASVGYCEPNYFTNVFHAETGISPKKYRLNSRKE